MITKLISLNNDPYASLLNLLRRAGGAIIGLLYHAITPLIFVTLSASLFGAEVYTYMYESKQLELKVSYLNVGQGDSTLIQTPNCQSFLIDAGQPTSPVLSEIGASMPFYRRHIDIIIATHPDADHIGGLTKVIERYNPQILFESGVHVDTYIDESLKNIIKEKQIGVIRARRGMIIIFSGNAISTLEILFPDRNVDDWVKKTNDASIVSRLSFEKTSFLFTGDSPVVIEKLLLDLNLITNTSVLKVGHHGSRTSTSDSFIKKLEPEIAVISSGKKNRYEHPHQEVINILNKNKVKILRTDMGGRIEIISDGNKLKLID